MIKLDHHDIGILFEIYGHAPTFIEINYRFRSSRRHRAVNLPDVKRRLYRLSRHGLCACDLPGMHPGQPRCWSLSPEGERVVEECDREWWDRPEFSYEYTRMEKS